MARTLGLAGIVVGAVIETPGCVFPCNQGCDDFIAITAHLGLDLSTLTDATVSLCLNARCTSGTFATVPSSMDDVVLMGAFSAVATPALDGSGGATVQITINGGGGYMNGDLYQVSITDLSGMQLFSKSAVAQYEKDADVCGIQCETLHVDLQ